MLLLQLHFVSQFVNYYVMSISMIIFTKQKMFWCEGTPYCSMNIISKKWTYCNIVQGGAGRGTLKTNRSQGTCEQGTEWSGDTGACVTSRHVATWHVPSTAATYNVSRRDWSDWGKTSVSGKCLPRSAAETRPRHINLAQNIFEPLLNIFSPLVH